MRSLIGEFIFGTGISLLAGAFVLLWQYISEFFPNLKFLYVGILICFGIALIWFGALKINYYENINKKSDNNQNDYFYKYFLSKLWQKEDRLLFGFLLLVISFILFNKYLLEILPNINSGYYLAIAFLLALFGIKLLMKK